MVILPAAKLLGMPAIEFDFDKFAVFMNHNKCLSKICQRPISSVVRDLLNLGDEPPNAIKGGYCSRKCLFDAQIRMCFGCGGRITIVRGDTQTQTDLNGLDDKGTCATCGPDFKNEMFCHRGMPEGMEHVANEVYCRFEACYESLNSSDVEPGSKRLRQ